MITLLLPWRERRCRARVDLVTAGGNQEREILGWLQGQTNDMGDCLVHGKEAQRYVSY